MIIDELFEAPQQCPECGGISFSDLILAEKKDACYHKVKASAKVWPSAYASGRLVQCRKKGAANYGNKSEGVAEASDQSNAISQEQLNQMYANAKPMMFIKNTPVALVPLAKINQIGTPQQVQQVQQALGSVDQTSYTDEYKNKGYVVFQWNGTALDLYVASPEVVSQKYVKFSGQLPQDEKSRGKIPSLIALSKLGIDPSKVPFFVKKVPNEMVSAKQLGLEGKTIQVFWGSDPSTQEVAPGGFLTKNEHGMIYTIAPDAQGLPIGYLPAQQGVAEAGFPGAPDVEMPPMNPSGDPQRDKLKQEYMDLHREIKSLVDLQYRSTSDEQKMQAKARIEQLNDRADQIKAILEPRQPPNEWQKKTYGFDDNWNKVNQGVAETELDEKSVSQAQFRTMAGAAHNPEFAKKVGISQDVAQEFNRADKHSNYKKLPARATEGEQQPGANYRDPPEDKDPDQYGDDYQAMVARVKKLAGLGPMKTVYDPAKRQYRNMPTAQQPKK